MYDQRLCSHIHPHAAPQSPPMAHTRQQLPLAILMVLTIFVQFFSADAQITFSRDWKNGKRAALAGAPTCLDSLPPPLAVCHTLMSELRAAAVCEARRLLRDQDSRDTRVPELYPGEATVGDRR